MRATTENLEHALSSLTIATTSSLQEGVPITTPPASAALSSLAITTSNSSDDGVRIRTPSTSTNSATTEDDQPTRYFDQFAGFVPNHKAPLLEEFRRLADFMDWRIGRKKGSKDKKGGKRELGGTKFKEEWLACCRMEYDYWYGKITRDNLVAWQGLCLDIAGVSDPPASITKCKKASGCPVVFLWPLLTV